MIVEGVVKEGVERGCRKRDEEVVGSKIQRPGTHTLIHAEIMTVTTRLTASPTKEDPRSDG